MATDALKKIYAANTTGDRAIDTLELSHSLFTRTYYLVRDNESLFFNIDGVSTYFQSWAFDFRLPEIGSEQQDMSIIFDNTDLALLDEIELAAGDFSEPIKATYRVYIESSADEQSTPMILSLTNIVADIESVSAVASRPDLFKRYFPSGNKAHFDNRFKGLFL